MTHQGALFDMDGLLLDTERLLIGCFQTAAAEMEIQNLTPVLLSLIGIRRKESEEILLQHIGKEEILMQFLTRSNELSFQSLEGEIPVKEGVFELLEALRDKGIPCAVATSTQTEKAQGHLQKSGLLDFFHSVTGGDQVVNAKPAPDIYIKAAKTLGLSAVDCVAFEDSDPGTRAAVASGAVVVQVPDLLVPSDEVRALNHFIAPSILNGATRIGLI